MSAGTKVGAIAMTEPNTGSDLQNIRTTAIRDGDEFVINGSKTYISNGQHCDLVIVVAKTDPSEGAKGISLIVVEDGTEGFSKGRNLKKLGQAAADTSELFFEDCRVPAENLVGEEGRGFVQLMQQLPQERLNIAQAAVVDMERAIALTLDFERAQGFRTARAGFSKYQVQARRMQNRSANCAYLCRSMLSEAPGR